MDHDIKWWQENWPNSSTDKDLFQNLSSIMKDILVKLTEKQCIPLQYDEVNSLFIKHVGNSFVYGFWDFEISLALTWWLKYC